MKYTLLTLGLVGFLLGGSAMADDQELNISSDRSENPITGTVTETEEYKEKKKRADGKTAKTEVKKTKKTKTDGTVEKKTESEHSAE